MADENVSRKFETCAQFPHLVQRKIPLLGQKHRDGTFRPKLRALGPGGPGQY